MLTHGAWMVELSKLAVKRKLQQPERFFMSDEVGFLNRMSRWFRRRFSPQDDLPLLFGQTETTTTLAKRSFLGFSWQRHGDDLMMLQNGMASMTALMTSLRHYLDQQSARHDELLNYLSQLSQALQAIPDSSRVQGETLRVLHQQIAYQNAQHKQLAEMLRRISESSGNQNDIVELLRERVETLYKNDQQISQTIDGMGNAMSVVTQNSQTNTLVLERLRDNLVTRDGDLERSIRQQNRWVIGTLMVAVFMSIAAIIVVIVVSAWSLSAISHVADTIPQRPAIPPTVSRITPDGPPSIELTLHPPVEAKKDDPAIEAVITHRTAAPTTTGPSTATTVPTTQTTK